MEEAVVEAPSEEVPAVTEQITEVATEAGTPAEASAVESSETAE